MEARKDDKEKLRYDLIPIQPLQEVARVFTIGARKYDDRNWEKGLSWGRLYAALQRHANSWWSGERHDQVDGQHHLASVAWCALALMEYERTHPELDDRSKQPYYGTSSVKMINDLKKEFDKLNSKTDEDISVSLYGNTLADIGKLKQGTDPFDDLKSTGEHGGV